MAHTGETTDVLVVGSGPIGMIVALLLARYGISVTLIEKDSALPAMPRAVALDDEAMRTLQQAGVAENMLPLVLLGYGHRYFGRSGRLLVEVDPSDQHYGYPKRVGFHQPELERVLLDAINANSRIESAFSTQLVELELDNDQVVATVERSGQARTVRARYVVGCDGGNSTTRRLTGIKMDGLSHPEPWIVVDTENNSDCARFSRALGNQVRPHVNVPGVSGRRRYEFMMLPGETEEEVLDSAVIQRLLAPHCDTDRVSVTRSAVYTFHSLVAGTFSWRRRIFLAGDAAHMMPPFQGQGMNSGVRDAANISWKISAVIKGELGEAVLDSYDRERRPHVRAMVDISRRVGKLLMTRNGLNARLRDLSFALLSFVPPVAAYVRGMGFKPQPVIEHGFFLDGTVSALPGKMFPQPDVVLATGKRAPLDYALGTGFALLQLANGPCDGFAEFEQPIWSRIGARKILALPGGLDHPPHGADAVIGDFGGALMRAMHTPGNDRMIALIRPDRYVCAVMRPGDADALAGRLDALAPVASTPTSDY